MSCRCPLVPGLCFICHLCKLFSQHQSFSQLTCKFLKIRNHILYLFCKPEELHVLVMWTKFFCFGSAACHLCVCVCVCVLVTQSGLTLCDPMDYRLSGSSPGRNTGEGCHFLLQGNLPEPGIKAGCHLYILSKFPSLLQASVYLCEKRGNNIF